MNLVRAEAGIVNVVVHGERDHLLTYHSQAARSVDIVQDSLCLYAVTSPNNRTDDYFCVGSLSRNQCSKLLHFGDNVLWLLLDVVRTNVYDNSLVWDGLALRNVLNRVLQLVREGFFSNKVLVFENAVIYTFAQ